MFKNHVKNGHSIYGVAIVLALSIALAGCNEDNSSSASPSPTPSPPVNAAPAFSSAATTSVAENTVISFYTLSASDPEGDMIIYTISGGEDANAFTLDGDQLRFTTPPDHDLPGDANSDNVYKVQLQASDGQKNASLALEVIVTNDKEGIALHRVASGFDDPVAIAAIPGDTRLFVVERAGTIYLLEPATGQKTLFQTLANTSTEGERGLQAIAVAPDYQTSGRYFVMLSSSTGELIITYCRRSGTFGSPECQGNAVYAPHTEANDYSGFLGYGPDGKLYIATGDAGGSGDPSGSAQDDSSYLGKLVRLDDNPDPYAGASPIPYLRTIISKGFHNPRGGAFHNGKLLLADRGESVKEEVDLLDVSSSANYGWPVKEGTSLTGSATLAGAVDPVIEYPHSSGGGIVGGHVYGGQVASLKNLYIFADQNGAIYSVPAADIASGQTLGKSAISDRTVDFAPDAGSFDAPVAFAKDNQGETYIADSGGDIFRVDSE